MRTQYSRILAFATLITLAAHLAAQQPAAPKHEDTEVYEPVPPVITPGATATAPPSDAIVLFDAGTNLDQWVAVKDKSPANWIVADGIATVNTATGSIETNRSFKYYQPSHRVENSHQHHRHRSGGARQHGVFLASTGPGDAGYELQVLDSYNNVTYVNGQAGSIYKQGIPLANSGPQARRVADPLRRRLDSPYLQRRRLP